MNNPFKKARREWLVAGVVVLCAVFFIIQLSLAQSSSEEEEGYAPPEGITNTEETAVSEEMTPSEEVVGPEAGSEANTLRDQLTPSEIEKVSSGGSTITLNIKGMDILDVLKMLAMRSGLNIVAGRNVTGRVTIFLKDVDVIDALEIILASNDLAYEKRGDILNIMTSRDYELRFGHSFWEQRQVKAIKLRYAKAEELSRSLSQMKSNIGRVVVDEPSNTIILFDSPKVLKEMENLVSQMDLPRETRFFQLNYAQAAKVNEAIQELLTKGASVAKVDERTNKISITDSPQKLDEVTKVIRAFDEKTLEVTIEARIVEITLNDEFKMGVDWAYWFKKNVKFSQVLKQGLTSGGIFTLGVPSVTEPGEYRGLLDLLKTLGKTNILSTPRITVANNQEAKILVGTKEVYVTQTISQSGTGTEVTADQANFVDVGVKLYVTPTINKDGFVSMKIKPEVSSVSSSYEYTTGTPPNQTKKTIPIVTTSEAETTVMVKDGNTIIIAGLMKDKDDKTVNKVPVLGDIPLIGLLARKTTHTKTKTELVVFLTPYIMGGDHPIGPYQSLTSDVRIESVVNKALSDAKQVSSSAEVLPGPQSPVSFQDYTQGLRLKLSQRAREKVGKEGIRGEVDFSFTLLANGELKGEPRIVSATDKRLIKPIMDSIRESSPFPPFPECLAKQEETFHLAIAFE